jgi:1-acyl-sn-glycerol-3-phosphate acyltransferase
MSDCFYRAIRAAGCHVFWATSAPVVQGQEHIPARGPCLLVANHTSPYDVPLLIRHVPRLVDFVSITEVFRNPVVAWFYGSMNAFPLDRDRPDAPTVRRILDRLERGRLVAMFPEGRLRRGDSSVLRGGALAPGIGRLVRLAGAPLVPAVIVNSLAYYRFVSWLPLRRTVYGVTFGAPIGPGLEPAETERRLAAAMAAMYSELLPRLPEQCRAI